MKSLLLLALAMPCFGGWSQKGTVTFPAASGSTLTNFTAAFTGSDSKYATVANGGLIQHTVTRVGVTVPADLALTTDATCSTITGYSWGIETYDQVAGTFIGWAKLSTLTNGASVVPTVCVGNAAVSTYQGGAQGSEFDSNTLAAYHMPNGSVLSAKDFSSNSHDGTITGTTATTGRIDGAGAFSGSSQYIAVPAFSIPTDFTVQVWAKLTDFSTFRGLVTATQGNAAFPFDWYVVPGPNAQKFYVGTTSIQGNVLSTGTWYSFAATFGSGTMSLYRNGVSDAVPITGVSSPAGLANRVMIGARDDLVTIMSGTLDEARIIGASRSADWIATEYANQSSPPSISVLTPLATGGSKMLLLGAQ